MQTQSENNDGLVPQPLELQHVVDYIRRVASSKPYDSDLQRICRIAEEGIIAAEEAKTDLAGAKTDEECRMSVGWAFDALHAFLHDAYWSVTPPASNSLAAGRRADARLPRQGK